MLILTVGVGTLALTRRGARGRMDYYIVNMEDDKSYGEGAEI